MTLEERREGQNSSCVLFFANVNICQRPDVVEGKSDSWNNTRLIKVNWLHVEGFEATYTYLRMAKSFRLGVKEKLLHANQPKSLRPLITAQCCSFRSRRQFYVIISSPLITTITHVSIPQYIIFYKHFCRSILFSCLFIGLRRVSFREVIKLNQYIVFPKTMKMGSYVSLKLLEVI